MLSHFITDKIKSHLPFELTGDQNNVLEQLADFLAPQSSSELFLLKGYAGTGKTSIVGALVKAFMELKQKVILLAPTGRAAKVLSLYAKQPAQTIHKKIYRQKSAVDYSFRLDQNLHKHTLFIVDEASMISNLPSENSHFGTGYLLDDLIEYVYGGEGCRLLLLGDVAQLPPVGQVLSPALDKTKLDAYGFQTVECLMTQVVRQTSESGILHNATMLRRQIENGQTGKFPAFETEDFSDVIKISGEDLIEKIDSAYDEDGIENTMVVTRSNKRANIYAQGIRGRILYKEEEISSGDLLLITRNNYFWGEQGGDKIDFIANGDIAEVLRVRKHSTMYDFHFVELSLRFVDYDIEKDVLVWLDTLRAETPAEVSALNQQLYTLVNEDYAHIGNKRERVKLLRKNPYYNALQVKFAYAVTCHKAQGGQWQNVFIDQGYVTEETLGVEYYRWLYTAFTRATKQVYLVNF
ncbi:MAG: AAA family ATPase [Prevotellaceae bacterium]|nr:AAA family ATPase [Prevotellaceae bacterium]